MAVDPAKTYHGKPCKNCGGTLRWLCAYDCVACRREFNRAKRANDHEWAEQERRQRREKYANDHEWAEQERARKRPLDRKRYDNDVLFRHGQLVKAQLKRSDKRLQKAQEALNGQVQD